MLHHKCSSKADVVPVRQHSCIFPFTELWGGTADSLPHPVKRAWSALKACIFFQNIKGLVPLGPTANPGAFVCIPQGSVPANRLLWFASESSPGLVLCSLPLYLYHCSITAGCCREEMKRSLEVCFYECVNLFLNLLNYLLCLPFFNDRWIYLWLVLFPKVALGWSELITCRVNAADVNFQVKFQFCWNFRKKVVFYKLNAALCAFFLKKAWHLERHQEEKTNILNDGNLSLRIYSISYQHTAMRDPCGSPSAVCRV